MNEDILANTTTNNYSLNSIVEPLKLGMQRLTTGLGMQRLTTGVPALSLILPTTGMTRWQFVQLAREHGGEFIYAHLPVVVRALSYPDRIKCTKSHRKINTALHWLSALSSLSKKIAKWGLYLRLLAEAARFSHNLASFLRIIPTKPIELSKLPEPPPPPPYLHRIPTTVPNAPANS